MGGTITKLVVPGTPLYTQEFVLIGPAITDLTRHVVSYDTKKERDDTLRKAMAMNDHLKLSAFKSDGLPGSLLAADDALIRFDHPVNDHAPPLRGAMVFIGTGVGAELPPDPATMFSLLAARRAGLKKDLDSPAFSLFTIGGDRTEDYHHPATLKQDILESMAHAAKWSEETYSRKYPSPGADGATGAN